MDFAYLIFAIPGLILGLIAQGLLQYSYGRYSKVNAGSGLTGKQAAELINTNESFNVSFKITPGQLNDYYHPTEHLVNISEDNATNMSIANIAVVAHEFGHVEQKMKGDMLFKARTWLVPVVNFGGNIGLFVAMIGFAIASASLTWIGIALFATTTLFSLVTLPIEIDASRRGMNLIRKHGLIAKNQYSGARWVLAAAAMTYFAGLISAIGQLAYFVMMAQSNNRD